MSGNRLYIFGSGGMAKEVYALAKAIGKYKIKAFVDVQSASPIHFKEGYIPVIAESELDKLDPQEISLAIGVGTPSVIQKICEKYAARFHFPNLIHPSALGDFDNIELGAGNIIATAVVLTTQIKIGNFNILNFTASIGHDVLIGNYNVVNPGVNISGGVEIGNSNLLGLGSKILQYKKIGNNNIIGASSLVTKDIESDQTLIGIPAKPMKK